MDLNAITGSQAAVSAQYTSKAKAAAEDSEETQGFSDTAAVYEKSSDADKAAQASAPKKADRSAIVAQLKADAQARQQQLVDIVQKMMTKQGQRIGQADDIWKFLASGNFTVDAQTKAQAQADIADDGYWGVEQTSDRIVDFAKALAGDDADKADELLSAFKKGFSEATKSWGKTLPDISQRTYDAVVKKFDSWKNGTDSKTDKAAE